MRANVAKNLRSLSKTLALAVVFLEKAKPYTSHKAAKQAIATGKPETFRRVERQVRRRLKGLWNATPRPERPALCVALDRLEVALRQRVSSETGRGVDEAFETATAARRKARVSAWKPNPGFEAPITHLVFNETPAAMRMVRHAIAAAS